MVSLLSTSILWVGEKVVHYRLSAPWKVGTTVLAMILELCTSFIPFVIDYIVFSQQIFRARIDAAARAAPHC